jgi:hypothetical protein
VVSRESDDATQPAIGPAVHMHLPPAMDYLRLRVVEDADQEEQRMHDDVSRLLGIEGMARL